MPAKWGGAAGGQTFQRIYSLTGKVELNGARSECTSNGFGN